MESTKGVISSHRVFMDGNSKRYHRLYFGILFLELFLFFDPFLIAFGQTSPLKSIANGKEDYTLKTFTTANGLSHNNINCIVQDKTGFIWIATFDGLCRFDGYEFKKYYHQAGDMTSLPYFEIHSLCVDKDNNLWIVAGNIGLSLYDRSKDNFHTYSAKTTKSITATKVFGIDTDINGNLWFNGDDGLYRFDYLTKQFIHYSAVQTQGNYKAGSEYICIDNKNKIQSGLRSYILKKCFQFQKVLFSIQNQ